MSTSDDLTGDELASAYLDGEATSHEVALVESSPALLARVDELRAAAGAVAAPMARVADDIREAAIRSAIGRSAFPIEAGSAATSSLDAARLARARRSRRWLPALGAAAAAVVALGIGSAVLRSDGGPDVTAAGQTADEAGASGEERDDSAVTAAPPAGADALAYAALDAPLGSFDDTADIAAAVDDRLHLRRTAEAAADGDTPPTTAAAGAGGAGGAVDDFRTSITCFGPVVDGGGDVGDFQFGAPAIYRGADVIVLLFELPAGRERIYVVDAGTCAAVTTFDR